MTPSLIVERYPQRIVKTLDELEKAIDPGQHIGLAGALTDQLFKNATNWLGDHENSMTRIASCPLADTCISHD